MKKPILVAFLLSCLFATDLTAQRVLVISGGGARGAWGGGVAQGLCQLDGRTYEGVIGTSTGSLLMPLVALKDFERLKTAYTTTRQKDIFSRNPFKKNGELKQFCAFLRIIFGSKNLGESKRLRKRLDRFFTAEEFQKLRADSLTIMATVVSLTENKVETKSSDDQAYSDMLDWIWASANQPVFMSTLKKEGEQWVDGGLKDNVALDAAIEYALKHNIDSVDVIVNNLEEPPRTRWTKKRIIPKLLRTVEILTGDVLENDLSKGQLSADANGIILSVYFMTRDQYDLAPLSLVFDRKKMLQLWNEGFDCVKDKRLHKYQYQVESDGSLREME